MSQGYPRANLLASIAYLRAIVVGRLAIGLSKEAEISVQAPPIVDGDDPFTQFLQRRQPDFDVFITLLLALAPHLQADFYDNILKEYFPEGSHFPALGGMRGKNHRGILPTGETAQFVLAGNDLTKRLAVQQLFASDHWFATERILRLEEVPEGEPAMSGRLWLDPEWLERITTGRLSPPHFSTRFPAERLATELDWDDLVLTDHTRRQIA